MTTPTTYTNSISADLPGGSINLAKLDAEIRASAIATALDGLVMSGDELRTTFKDTLSAEDESLFAVVIAGHDSTPSAANNRKTEIVPNIGGSPTRMDGISCKLALGANQICDYLIEYPAHLQGVVTTWSGYFHGDYAWLSLTNPAGDGSPALLAAAGQNQVDMGAKAPYYDPANGAEHMEFYDANGVDPTEVIRIESVTGTVVTLKANLATDHPVTEKVRAGLQTFSPIRGVRGLDGGMRLVGSGQTMIRNEVAVTDLMPAGLRISAHVSTVLSATPGEREIALNFIWRDEIAG